MATARSTAAVLVNRGGGSVPDDGLSSARIAGLFADIGIEAHVQLLSGGEIQGAAQAALSAGVDLVVAGGGDGTVSTVAGVLAETEVPMGVLPLGTRNNFARDLNIPLGLEEAVQALGTATLRHMDVADVNGRVFVNNSLIGFYPAAVDARNRLREKVPLGKTLATWLSAARVFPGFPIPRVTFEAEGERRVEVTPFIFIGNNPYEMNLFRFGARNRFADGQLFLYYARCHTRACLARLAATALVKDVKQDRRFASWKVSELTLDTGAGPVRVFVDGETITLTSPLQYRIRPKALAVLLPSETDRS